MIKILKFTFALLLLVWDLASCKSAANTEKCYEKQEKNKAEMEQKAYDARVKHHKDMQSKNTLKMLKKTEKDAKKLNKSKIKKSKPCGN